MSIRGSGGASEADLAHELVAELLVELRQLRHLGEACNHPHLPLASKEQQACDGEGIMKAGRMRGNRQLQRSTRIARQESEGQSRKTIREGEGVAAVRELCVGCEDVWIMTIETKHRCEWVRVRAGDARMALGGPCFWSG